MTDSPAVSIMVPVFNREDLLGPCLESALKQTFRDIEIVLVDGASTDGTWNICEKYAAADSRVRAIREQSNSGPVGGWSRCLEEARGRYATFLWSDDLLKPTFVERTVPFLEDPTVAFVFTAAEIGAAPGAGEVRYSFAEGELSADQYLRRALAEPSAFPASPACGLFRLSDLRAALTTTLPTNPPIDFRWTGAGTDVLFYLLTAARYRAVRTIAEPLAFFRAHPGSISVDGRGGLVRLHYAIARAWFARRQGYEQAVDATLAWHWLTDMALRHRPVAPWTAARRYGGLTRPWALIRGGGRRLAAAAMSDIAHAGRRRMDA